MCLGGSALLRVEEGTPRMARGGLEEKRRAVLDQEGRRWPHPPERAGPE